MHDRTNPPPTQAVPPVTQFAPHRRRERDQAPSSPAMPPAPWGSSGVDPDQAVADLGNRFPRATVWFGDFTGSYWALIRAEDSTTRLLEGTTAEELSHLLESTEPRAPWDRQPLSPPTAAHKDSATLAPYRATPPSTTRRTSHGRGRARSRHSAPRTLRGSGRC